MRRALILFAACVTLVTGAAQAQFYFEDVESDLNSLTPNNDGETSNGWHWDATCPATAETGHSAPGSAHWNNPDDCDNFGTGESGSVDLLVPPAILVPDDCSLGVRVEFNYFLNFAESACFDRARLEVTVNGGASVVYADNGSCGVGDFSAGRPGTALGGGSFEGIGNLANASTWLHVQAIVPDAVGGTAIQLFFVGETVDEINNGGQGFLVDDVAMSCVVPAYEVPAIGPAGFAALAGLLALAAIVVIARRRRAA